MKYMRTLGSVLVLVSISLLAGCATLTQEQKTEYTLMEKDGVLVKEKDPKTGAWFGLLPGGGAFYGREPAVGVIDLLLWPLSILWDTTVGFQTSKTVNYNLTVSELGRAKAKEMNELEAERDVKKIDDVTYAARKREIEQKYDYRAKL
jgi:hypothetical protein